MADVTGPRAFGQRVTLRDIAEWAGVHVSTVSRVLNRRDGGMTRTVTRVPSPAILEKIGDPMGIVRGMATLCRWIT